MPLLDLLVIDISEFPEDLSELRDHPLLLKLRKACEEWRLFYLVNHGIPVDLLERADNVCRDLLSLPTEVKERATTGNQLDTYSQSPKIENFRFSDSTNPASIQQMCAKMFPEGNPIFCETMETYAFSVSNLEEKITKIILASIGLEANAFYHSHFDKCTSILNINGYPSDSVSSGEKVLHHHTDLGCLTILYQDEMGGLQVRSREGEWFDVKHLPHAFVINLGDSFKAWSNGRYRSAEHRVVYNGWKDRISIAFFTSFRDEKEIWALEELVDDDNPRRYKPLIFPDFMHQPLVVDKNKDRPRALQKFAGI